MIKVFFDTSPLETGHAPRGIGSYTRNLKDALERIKDVKLVDGSRAPDITHYPFFDFFFNSLPSRENTPIVVTVYDTIPLIYPKHYPPGVRGRSNFFRQKRKLQKADAVITISETSKKDIARFLDIPQDKIFVTYLAPGRNFRKMENGKWKMEITKRYGLPQRFVLYVGDVNYNKNLFTLAEACKVAKIPVVLVGKQAAQEDFDQSHPENRSLVQLLKKYGKDPDVLRIGFVPDEDLVKIYNLATLYCQPSFYEGFGLPVLDAMACGTPVVAAKTQALVEIAEGAASFADPKNPNDVAQALKKVILDKKVQNSLAKAGLAHVKQFSWDKVADETFAVYKKVVGKD